MKNKIISALTAVCIIFSAAVSAAEIPADAENTVYEQAVKLLFELDIMSADKHGNFAPEIDITRGELCGVAAKIMNIGTGAADKNIFADIAEDNPYKKAINEMAVMGYVSGDGRGNFEPERYAVAGEAVKLIVEILGYGDAAKVRGGYPAGYFIVANDIKLTQNTGVKAGGNITRGELALLVRNALDIKMYDVTEYMGDGSYEKAAGEDTILSRYYGILNEKGVVSSNEYTSLDSNNKTAKGEIIVNGVLLKTGSSDISKYLGYRVNVYYYEEDEKIIFFELEKSNSVVKINAKQKPYYENGRVYFDKAEDKKSSEKIDAAAAVIYNGCLIESFSGDYFDVKEGSVTLIDSGSDGVYETVVIEKYSTFIVHYLDIPSGMLYLKNKNTAPIDTEETECEYYDEYGGIIDETYIKEWNVLSALITADESMMRFYRSNRSVTGTVAGISEDELIFDGGAAYSFVSDYTENFGEVKFGETRVYYLDIFGNIAAEKKTKNERMLGYIREYAYDALSGMLSLRLLVENGTSSDGKFIITETNGKIDFDGSRITARKAYEKIEKNEASRIDALIAFELDGEGRITYIDTPVTAEGEDEDFALTESYRPTSSVVYRESARSFSGAALLESGAKIFYIPQAEKPEDVIADEGFAVYDANALGNDTTHQPIFTTYKFGVDSIADTAVVYKKSAVASEGSYDTYMHITVIESVKPVYDAERDEIVSQVTGYTGLSRISAAAYSPETVEDLNSGDVVKLSYNSSGQINAYRKLFNIKEKKVEGQLDGEMYNTANFHDRQRSIFGYVYQIKDNAMLVTKYSPAELAEKEAEIRANLKPGEGESEVRRQMALLCEKHSVSLRINVWDCEKNDKAAWSRGNTKDIYSYTEFGAECSKVYMYSVYSVDRDMVVYKNIE